ncbi:hypothetical protein [Oenococcus oeni]|nr:hypothetical protein [Oenococcus oeni]
MFNSADMTFRTVIKEGASFFTLRGASLLANTAI